jgi:tRNA C32,U32 (ribose-2'-O)-methylase TrmJ
MAQARGYLPFKNLHIILCRPEKSGNVGSTARVMFNFGLSSLRVVSERKVPHVSTIEASKFGTAHASHILNDAKVYPTLKEVL